MIKYRPPGSAYIRGECFIEGCNQLQRFKGRDKQGRHRYAKVCDKHHRIRYNIGNPFEKYDLNFKNKLPNDKCEFCGWDKAPCDRHRKDSDRGYLPENVTILCPNCHRLVTLGLINC